MQLLLDFLGGKLRKPRITGYGVVKQVHITITENLRLTRSNVKNVNPGYRGCGSKVLAARQRSVNNSTKISSTACSLVIRR